MLAAQDAVVGTDGLYTVASPTSYLSSTHELQYDPTSRHKWKLYSFKFPSTLLAQFHDTHIFCFTPDKWDLRFDSLEGTTTSTASVTIFKDWFPPDPQRIRPRTSGPSYSESEIQRLLDQAARSTPLSESAAQSLQQLGSSLAHRSARGAVQQFSQFSCC